MGKIREHTNEGKVWGASYVREKATRLKIPISTVRAIRISSKQLLQTCLEEDPSLFCPHTQWGGWQKQNKKNHCLGIAEESSILGSSSLQNNKSTQKWLTEHKIKLLPWPTLSPDLNLWAELKRRVHKREPRILDDLERFCEEEWSLIPFFVFYILIRCYGRSLCAVLLAKGGCTKY